MNDQDIIFRGERDGYFWLSATGDVYIGTLLNLCPEAVFGRYLAITSTDSDVRAIRYLALVTAIEALDFQRDGPDGPGFDEWYVFQEPRHLGEIFRGDFWEYRAETNQIFVFANIFGFALHDPHSPSAEVYKIFWDQLLRLSPETFIADGRDSLTLVSKNRKLLDDFELRLKSPA